MARGGIALALLLGVLVALYVVPAFRQFAHQLDGHVQPGAKDLKSIFHASQPASERQDDHA